MARRVSKILIANRGEIAVRVIRTARRLGYRTVAVYSSADAAAPHVALADEAILIGRPPATESYLSIDKVLDAARRSGADAVHPGYGFLSENARFAEACEAAGITFIGPPASAIDKMGNKRAAKLLMRAAGVPCVPGFEAVDPSDDVLDREATKIGFPIMVKAAAGGGGRGMRRVDRAEDLRAALTGARAEATSAFGSGEIILERAVIEPRHVEIQVFADAHGHVIHLGERDCSVQRRHQKVIEESPSPAVDEGLREKMGRAAVEAARAVGYVGAGTVELLLDRDGSFYFLEMNTRLQVEHPVTEMCTGIDLVEWQIRVAAGEPLPIDQSEVALTGHAIEARLYAEDPANEFLPQTGELVAWRVPDDDVRIDAGVVEGGVVSPFYDPMLAKVIAHGATRDDARRKLAAALADATVFGVTTNKAFLVAVCEHPAFAAGEATTAFIDQHMADHPSRRADPPASEAFALAALVIFLEGGRAVAEDESFIGWRSGGPAWSTVRLAARGHSLDLRVTAEGRGSVGRRYRIEASASGDPASDPARHDFEVAWTGEGEIGVATGGLTRRVRFAIVDSAAAPRVWLDDGVATAVFDDWTHRAAEASASVGSGRIVAPLDGAVMAVHVEVGDSVEIGQPLVVVEAMKMEHRVEADLSGRVVTVLVEKGQQVKTGQLLVELAPAPTESTPAAGEA